MFNTLKYAKELEAVGISRDQAEAHVRIIAEIVEGDLATKQDIMDLRNNELKDIRNDFKELEYRLTIKLGTMMTLAVGAIVALLKLF